MLRKNQAKVIRKVENNVEFYTLAATGESGLSVTGLAMLCGVSHQVVSSTLANSAATRSGYESLQPLYGKDFVLQLGGEFKNAVIVSDWACRCIIEYFAFDSRKPRKEARQIARQFMQAGVRRWIHQITGWEEKVEQSSAIAFLVQSVVREPKAWEVHFTPDWIREAERITGWKWSWGCMAGFINRSIYEVLPLEFRQKLDEVNPVLPHGRRGRKQHQHVTKTVSEQVLKQLIAETLGIMRCSASEMDYWRSHQNAYTSGYQLTLTLGGTVNA